MYGCVFIYVYMCTYALILLYTPLLLKHPAKFIYVWKSMVTRLCPRMSSYVPQSQLECFALWFNIFLSSSFHTLHSLFYTHTHSLSLSLSLSLPLFLSKQTNNILLLLQFFFLFKILDDELLLSLSISPTLSDSFSRSPPPNFSFLLIFSSSISCLQCS